MIAGTLSVLSACGSAAHPPATGGSIPRQLEAEARPIGTGARFRPPARGPIIGACRRQLGPRFGVHIEVFGANRVVIVPAGIGARPPRRITDGRISAARCYGSLVTLEPTGLVLVRPGSHRSLADLARSWGEPLSAHGVASFPASASRPLRVFVDGRRWRGAPGGVPLSRHAEIVVESGPYVPPHRLYLFAPGT